MEQEAGSSQPAERPFGWFSMNFPFFAAPSGAGSDTRTNQLFLNSPSDAPTGPTAAYGASPQVSGQVQGRAAAFADTADVAPYGRAGFFPSAIPVKSQFAYGAGATSSVQGSGSAFQVQANGNLPSVGDYRATATFGTQDTDASSAGLGVLQAYVRLDNLAFGTGETAFADKDAVPDTLDLAGPNARITTMQPGVMPNSGQGLITYYWFFSQSKFTGLIGDFSVETPTPEVRNLTNLFPPPALAATLHNSSTFARYPDMISALKYSDGEEPVKSGDAYHEFWHIQVSSVVRSIGFVDDTAFERTTTGWGVVLSSRAFIETSCSSALKDAIYFSTGYGEGIAHYISDLHVASTDLKNGGDDAVLNGSGELVPLPVFAYYAGYGHNWSDHWKSTLVYSHVDLNSQSFVDPHSTAVVGPSPYRHGDDASINFVYHVEEKNETNGRTAKFDSGFEYLFGQKQVLNGDKGDDQRFMFVMQFGN
jgi:hypothetical protein